MNQLYPILFNLSFLIAITAIHLFWLMGGKAGLKYAFPHNSKHKRQIYKPTSFVIFLTSVLVGTMGWFCIAQTGSFDFGVDQNIIKWGNRIGGIVLLMRAIGNFKYIGFTKTFMEGSFAPLDTYIYSPLCLIMALFSWL